MWVEKVSPYCTFRFSGNTSWSCTSEDSRESHPGPLMPVPTLWSIMYYHAKHIWGSFPLFRCYWFTAPAFLLGLLRHHCIEEQAREKEPRYHTMGCLVSSLIYFQFHLYPCLCYWMLHKCLLQFYLVISQEASLSRCLYGSFFSTNTFSEQNNGCASILGTREKNPKAQESTRSPRWLKASTWH